MRLTPSRLAQRCTGRRPRRCCLQCGIVFVYGHAGERQAVTWAEDPVMQWTDADFDQLSWYDNHVHGIQVEVDDPDHGTGTITLDLDHIIEWIPPSAPGKAFRFRIAPARLTFHEISSLRIEIDWAAATTGMTPFSIDEIARRRLEYATGYSSWAWTIEVNWPQGAITLDSPRFTQRLSGPVTETDEQCLPPAQRTAV